MIDSRKSSNMIDSKLYSTFVNNCLCKDCPKNKKISRKNGTINKVISCSGYRNKPKSYISRCKEFVNL